MTRVCEVGVLGEGGSVGEALWRREMLWMGQWEDHHACPIPTNGTPLPTPCTRHHRPTLVAGVRVKKVAKYEVGEADFHDVKRKFVDALLDPLEGPASIPTPAMFAIAHKEVSMMWLDEIA
jgi:hypothetical protein